MTRAQNWLISSEGPEPAASKLASSRSISGEASTTWSCPRRLASSSARSARSSSSSPSSGSLQRATPTEAREAALHHAGAGLRHHRAQALGRLDGLGLVHLGQHHHELVAAHAAQAVVGAELGRHAGGHALQQPVAH